MGAKVAARREGRAPAPDRRIVELAAGQHGVVSRGQLLGMGLGRRAIGGRLERGLLRAVHRGVYAVGAVELSREGSWAAALLACGWDGCPGSGLGPGAGGAAPSGAGGGESGPVLGHGSAAVLWGLLRPRSALPEVVVAPASGRRQPGIVAHRQPIRADEVEVVDGIPVTCAARTVFDLAGAVRERELERAWNEMEVRQLTSRLSVPHLLERYPGRPGAPALRRLLGSVRPGGVTRNGFEDDFVALLDANGLPRPHLNADLWLRGRFVEVDCLWRAERVALELDGRAVHAREAAFESDKRRDRELLVAGWRPGRITWQQLRDEPGPIVADLRALLCPLPADPPEAAAVAAGGAGSAYP